MAHTYTVHLQVGAESDAGAWEAAQAIFAAAEGVISRTTPSGYKVDRIDVTDADDWAEHVAQDLACLVCSRPADRSRVGFGQRVCLPCISQAKWRPYPIEEVEV